MLRYPFIIAILTAFTFAACESEPEDPMATDPAEEILEGEVAPDVPEVTDVDLEKFAKINLAAQRQELDPVADHEEFISVIEREGLTQERYSEVHLAIEREPQLLIRVHEKMDLIRESDYEPGTGY
jgi:hypothetical protein